jgi:hypothetical protein
MVRISCVFVLYVKCSYIQIIREMEVAGPANGGGRAIGWANMKGFPLQVPPGGGSWFLPHFCSCPAQVRPTCSSSTPTT